MKLAPLVVLAVLAGCPSKKKASERMDDAIGRMNAFADQMCACKDTACADKVQADMTAWSTEMASSTPQRDQTPTEAQMQRMIDIGTKYAECMAKLIEIRPIAGSAQ